jgi:enoyl-CoA hydratase/carnithine racemase
MGRSMWNGFMAPIAFAHFLRLRFYYSMFSRSAIRAADARMMGYVNSAPEPVKGVYTKARELVARWAGNVLAPAQEPVAPARR